MRPLRPLPFFFYFFAFHIPPTYNMGLESLPPELLTIILQNNESLLDLHSLISASPACLRVFNSASKIILPVVIRNAIPEFDLVRLNQHLKLQACVTQRPGSSSDDYIDEFLKKYICYQIKYYMRVCTYMYDDTIDIGSTVCRILARIKGYKLYMRLYNLIQVYSTCLTGLGLDAARFTCTPPKLTGLQKAFLLHGFRAESLLSWAIDPETAFTNYDHPKLRSFDRHLARLTPRDVEKLVCVELYAFLS